jgi:hypothetical protein
MRRIMLIVTLLGAGVGACKGDPSGPAPLPDGSINLLGIWRVSDSTIYDITNESGVADGLRHIGAYVVNGSATLGLVSGATYWATMQVTVTYVDSVEGSPARRTPQSLSFGTPIVILHDSIFGLAAGGDVVPPAAGPTSAQISWAYDETSGQCRTMIAGFQPATAACRQSVRWRR